MLAIETNIVANEAALVPMLSHCWRLVGSLGPLVGTMISQPGSMGAFEALAMVPFW